VSEQASAAEQISKEVQNVSKLVAGIARSMEEQSSGAQQITASSDQLRRQAEQAAAAGAEQTKAVRDVSTSSENIAKQIKSITLANREHSAAAAGVSQSIKEIRGVSERNGAGVKRTLARADALRENSESLAKMIDLMSTKQRTRKPARAGNSRGTTKNGAHPDHRRSTRVRSHR